MKRQLYIVLALIVVADVAWSHGFRSNYGSSPYGISSPRHSGSSSNPFSTNAPQFGNNHFQGHLHNNPYARDSVSNFHSHHQHSHSLYSAHAPHGGRSPYTPYSTPNSYGRYVNPYAPDSLNTPYNPNIPYSPGNIANPYGIYGPNSASGSYLINAQQFYNSQRSYLGNFNNPYNPDSAPPLYGPYSNPFFQ